MKIINILKKIYIKFLSQNQYIKYLKKKGVKIGQNCDIHKNAVFGSEPYLISIGDNVRITQNVQFITHDGGIWVLRNLGLTSKNADKIGKIKIGNNVNIGWNAIIMPNINIGDNVVIGAGSIVTKNIPSNSVAVGIPARVIESIEQYYIKNQDNLIETKNLTPEEKKKYLLKKYQL